MKELLKALKGAEERAIQGFVILIEKILLKILTSVF